MRRRDRHYRRGWCRSGPKAPSGSGPGQCPRWPELHPSPIESLKQPGQILCPEARPVILNGDLRKQRCLPGGYPDVGCRVLHTVFSTFPRASALQAASPVKHSSPAAVSRVMPRSSIGTARGWTARWMMSAARQDSSRNDTAPASMRDIFKSVSTSHSMRVTSRRSSCRSARRSCSGSPPVPAWTASG